MAKRSQRRVTEPRSDRSRLQVKNLGPIRDVDVRFGDLTTLVGPQATGKSVFLETLKLVVDHAAIRRRLEQSDAIQVRDNAAFLQLVYGEGMQGIWSARTSVLLDGGQVSLKSLAKESQDAQPRLFYIPAQRVMSLRGGFTRSFGDFKAGDPFVLRIFSQELHELIQSDFIGTGKIIPRPSV